MQIVKIVRQGTGKVVNCVSCGADTKNHSEFCDNCQPVELIEVNTRDAEQYAEIFCGGDDVGEDDFEDDNM